MFHKRSFLMAGILALTMISIGGCVAGTPEVIENVVTKEVEKIVTQEVVKEVVVTATPEPAKETVMNLNRVQEQKGLESWAGGIVGAAQANQLETSLIFDTLLLFDPTYSELKPNIAESWQVSDDNLVYTFHLRQGVLFHDGEEVHADDVIASVHAGVGNSKTILRAITPIAAVKGLMAYRDGETDKIEGIEALDEYTVQFTLAEPSYSFLQGIAAQPILPEHLISETLAEDPALFFQSDFVRNPIGTGPWKIARREPGDFDELVAFDDYFLGRPKIDKVMIWNRDPILQAEDGTLDFYWGKDPAQVAQLLKIEGMSGYPVENSVYKRELWANMDDPLMQDIRVRQAIAYAIDREAISEDFFEGYAEPWMTVVPPTFWANRDLPPIPYDPEKSKALLAEAGWDPATELTLVYYYADTQSVDFMALLQSYLAEVGINVQPRLIERDVTPILHDKTQPFQLAYGARNTQDDSILEEYRTGASNSVTEYSNPEVDKLLDELAASLDTQERKAIADQIQEIIMADMPTIPLYTTKEYIFISDRLNPAEKLLYRYAAPIDLKLHEWEIVE
jgi:peptide/nickel transport system substrate-binding protein